MKSTYNLLTLSFSFFAPSARPEIGMARRMIVFLARLLILAAMALLFVTYGLEVPGVLTDPNISNPAKNHTLREMIFGSLLALWTIKLSWRPVTGPDVMKTAIIGAAVVLPVWIGVVTGYGFAPTLPALPTDIPIIGGQPLSAQTLFGLYGTQTGLFTVGIIMMWSRIRGW